MLTGRAFGLRWQSAASTPLCLARLSSVAPSRAKEGGALRCVSLRLLGRLRLQEKRRPSFARGYGGQAAAPLCRRTPKVPIKCPTWPLIHDFRKEPLGVNPIEKVDQAPQFLTRAPIPGIGITIGISKSRRPHEHPENFCESVVDGTIGNS